MEMPRYNKCHITKGQVPHYKVANATLESGKCHITSGKCHITKWQVARYKWQVPHYKVASATLLQSGKCHITKWQVPH